MQRRAVLIGLPLVLAGCGAESVWAPEEEIARVRYRHPGPTSLSLFTVRNNGDNQGAHTALMISASQRVIFDPAGTFGHPSIPERNDVVFGITPRVEGFYTSYHARASFHVIRQTVEVTPEVAEQALALAQGYGPVAKANCTRATSDILNRLPGFESLPNTWFPENLMEAFQALPGVQAEFFYEDDDDDKEIARAAYDALVRGETRLNRTGVAPAP
jgi:hypothetical protein